MTNKPRNYPMPNKALNQLKPEQRLAIMTVHIAIKASNQAIESTTNKNQIKNQLKNQPQEPTTMPPDR